MSQDHLEKVFKLLTHWRRYPNYQLERRADIFFAANMEPILYTACGQFELDILIPEFPLRKGLIYPELDKDAQQRNRSVKVDYLCVDKARQRCLLVELKTDDSSVRPDQMDAMRKGQCHSLSALLTDLEELRRHSAQAHKYRALLEDLDSKGLLELGPDGRIRKEAPSISPKPELIFIKPTKEFRKAEEQLLKEGDVVIDFDQVRNALGPYCGQDPLAALFSQALKDWSGTDKN